MHCTHRRALLAMTTGIAVLTTGVAPALAGSDGCSSDDCGPPPAIVAPVAPQPLTDGRSAPEHIAPPARHVRTRHAHRVRAVTVAQRIAVPRGAVAAGAGGTAPGKPDGVLALLAGGALVLVATGGGLVTSSRRAAS